MNLKPLLERFKEKIFFLSIFLVFISSVHAQQSVSGKVLSDGLPLVGANVVVKDTKILSVTDFDGKFKLSAPNDAKVLVVSYVGYQTKEVQISEGEIIVNLVEEVGQLKEVIVSVGYGTQKSKNVTNAISTIKADAFENRPILNVAQAIQGNATGVNVVQTSGKPGASFDVRIR